MKVFTDRMTRGAMWVLLIHGVLVFLIGIQLFAKSLYYVKNQYGTPVWRIFPAVGGTALAVVVGAAIAVLSGLRLRKPFDGSLAKGLSPTFKTVFAAEVVLVFIFGSMILDCGETAGRMLLCCVALNLLLLGLFGKGPRLEV